MQYIPSLLFDEHNCALMDQARPIKWTDPVSDPDNKYDIIAIGGGAGGLVTSIGSAFSGALKVGLIERSLMGGDCLNTGCVPSKAFLKSAMIAHNVRNSHKYGIKIKGEIEIDFPAVMERMRRIRADIAEADSATRLAKEIGVDVFLGQATFTGPNELTVNGQKL
jgi:pyruvate/2-oxoglutarate dehydrogenase complex dihydrolipoamide dehydrogenase (E3) component